MLESINSVINVVHCYYYFQLSPDGILDEETISRGLSNLGRSADGTHQVYLHVTVPVIMTIKFWCFYQCYVYLYMTQNIKGAKLHEVERIRLWLEPSSVPRIFHTIELSPFHIQS